MKKSQDFKLADIYSLPPNTIQSFDSWMEGNEALPAPPVGKLILLFSHLIFITQGSLSRTRDK